MAMCLKTFKIGDREALEIKCDSPAHCHERANDLARWRILIPPSPGSNPGAPATWPPFRDGWP